jgi:Uma2 family endonuclease
MKTPDKWSVAEYHHMIETGLLEGKPAELLEGEIIEMSPEGVPHSYTNRSVGNYLRQLLQDQALISEAHSVTLNNYEPEPDIAVLRLPDTRYATHHPYPQDIYWLIEIADRTLKKDLKVKSITYAHNGIPEYWVFDLPHRKLWVFTRPENERYKNCFELSTGTITPVAFPNIEVEVNKLLIVSNK